MKSKTKAFPFGGTQEKKEDPTGKQPPEQIPSDTKEAKMPLDQEGKDYVTKELDPLKKKLQIVDKVAEDTEASKINLATLKEAVDTIREKLTSPPLGSETKTAPLSEQQVAQAAARIIRQEDETKRQQLEQDEARKKEREEHERLRKLCLDDPELPQCKNVTELIDKRTVAKIEEVIRKKKEEPEAEPSPGLSLPKKFEELTGDEQESLRKQIGEKVPHPVLLGILEECNKSGDKDKCDLAGFVARVFPKETAQKLLDEGKKEVTTTVCKDGECKPVRISLKEDGIAFLQKTEKGTWEPVDDELKKEVEEQFEKRLKEELKKQPLF